LRRRDSFVNRLKLGFGTLVATTLLVLIAILVSEQRVGSALEGSERALALLDRSKEVQIQFSAARAAERRFLLEDLHTPSFFQSGDSPALERHRAALAELEGLLDGLEGQGSSSEVETGSIRQALDVYRHGFSEMVSLYRERGFIYSGRIEEMRRAALELQDLLQELPKAARMPLSAELLELNRDQGEYLRDFSKRSRFLVTERLKVLHEEVDARDGLPKQELHAQIDAYQQVWARLIEIDDRLGDGAGTGLRGTLNGAEQAILPPVRSAVESARRGFDEAARSVHTAQVTARFASAGVALLAVLLALSFAISLTAQIRGSLGALLRAVDAYASGKREARVGALSRRDEFAVVGESFDRMAQTLAENALELEEINASLELAVKHHPARAVETIKTLVAERKPADR